MNDEISTAQQLLKQVAAHGKRWGKHGSLKDFSQMDVMAALVTLDGAGLFEPGALALREDLTTARRQLGAANARLAKYEKAKAAHETNTDNPVDFPS